MSNYPPQPQAPPLKKPRRNRLCINLERTQNLLQLKRFPDCGTNTQRVANANTPGYSFNFTDGDRLKWKRTAFNRCFESVEMRRGGGGKWLLKRYIIMRLCNLLVLLKKLAENLPSIVYPLWPLVRRGHLTVLQWQEEYNRLVNNCSCQFLPNKSSFNCNQSFGKWMLLSISTHTRHARNRSSLNKLCQQARTTTSSSS